MWIEAVLLTEELSMLVGQFAPVTIRLGEDGELQVHDPSEITIVPDVGLRVVCKAKLRWTVLGFAVPVTLDSLAVLLLPAIVKRGDVDVLVFRLEIEEADIAGLPTGIDSRITDIVNHELEAKHVELSWDYAATLNHQFDLPDLLKPVERLKLTVGGARVKASGGSLALAIEFYVDVLRGLPPAASPTPPLAPTAAPLSAGSKLVHAAKAPARWLKSAIVGGLAVCALWGPYFLGRARG
jgi:hypothetical protein